MSIYWRGVVIFTYEPVVLSPVLLPGGLTDQFMAVVWKVDVRVLSANQ